MSPKNNGCYISTADAYNVLTDYYHHNTVVQHANLLEALLKVPPAEVRPVVRGENIGTVAECDQFICSKCGIHLENWVRVEIDEDDGDVTHHEYVFNVCPNCGADMRPAPTVAKNATIEEGG